MTVVKRFLDSRPPNFSGKADPMVCEEDLVNCEKMLRMARRRYYPFQVDLRMKTASGTVIVAQAAACATWSHR